jgi:aldehyde oxidoreductase
VVRPRALEKVCGLADYGDDQELKMPADTLHVAVVQPRAAHHARILEIDISEAEKMPGVKKVILAADLKAAGGTNIMAEGQMHERTTVMAPSREVLNETKIYRYGDVVALVAAATKDRARAAAAKVKVKIEQLPEYLNFLEAVMPDAARIHEDTPNIFCIQPLLKGAGLEEPSKVAEIIDASPYSVEGSFYSARQPHLTIEGDSVQAYFDEEGFLTFQCKSQGVYSSIGRIGNSIGIPKDKLRVVMNPTAPVSAGHERRGPVPGRSRRLSPEISRLPVDELRRAPALLGKALPLPLQRTGCLRRERQNNRGGI